MSWLVKNSDEGQPRPPMFQQGKQHHSVISLVLFYFVSQYYLNLPCFLQAYSRHKSFLTSKPCLPIAAGGLVAEAVRRLENKVDKVRLNARLVELCATNQFALNPKWKFKVSASLLQRTYWIYNLISFLRSGWLVRLASLKASGLLWDIQIFKKNFLRYSCISQISTTSAQHNFASWENSVNSGAQ